MSADFRVLDARRHKLKQRSILPLMKAEKKRLADPYSLCLGPSEKEIGVKLITILYYNFISLNILPVTLSAVGISVYDRFL